MPELILPRIAAGDRSAVGECLARYGGLVWSLARRFLGDPEGAEDAVQEIFIDLWNHAGRFDPSRSSEITFVAMIARRRLIDAVRKSSRLPVTTSLATAESLACGPDAEARAERAEDVVRASAALDALPPDQRRVLSLAIRQGRTYDQIARETGLPLGTVKTHARRGLIRLREALGADCSPAAKAEGRP